MKALYKKILKSNFSDILPTGLEKKTKQYATFLYNSLKYSFRPVSL